MVSPSRTNSSGIENSNTCHPLGNPTSMLISLLLCPLATTATDNRTAEIKRHFLILVGDLRKPKKTKKEKKREIVG